MTKKRKAQGPAVPKDFHKTKKRVGKSAGPKANATATEFRAQKIHVPTRASNDTSGGADGRVVSERGLSAVVGLRFCSPSRLVFITFILYPHVVPLCFVAGVAWSEHSLQSLGAAGGASRPA